MDAVFRLADRISVLVDGRIIATGAPARDPQRRRGAPRLPGRRALARRMSPPRCLRSATSNRLRREPGAVRHRPRDRRPARSSPCSAATAWARPPRCARSWACSRASGGAIGFAGQRIERHAPERIARARHRAGARGPPDLPEPQRAREPRAPSPATAPAGRAVDVERVWQLFPRLERARRQHGQPALRRRAADAGHRPRAGDQPAPADPRRGHRRPGAADPRGDLGMPGRAARRRAGHPGDRQVRRAADRARRPPHHHRARPRRLAGHLGRAGGEIRHLWQRLARRSEPASEMVVLDP